MQIPKTPHLEMVSIAALKPYARNARTHSRKQVAQIADSIARFGWTNPVLVSDDGEIIAGHGRVLAAKQLGLDMVPTLKLSHLSVEERRAYVLADNKLAENAGWDTEILAIEFQELSDLGFDLELGNAAAIGKDGAIAFVCMDWRHMRELQDAGAEVFTELKNLCVWNKTNGGMGSFYRSKHELIFVYKIGTLPHTNGFGLGETGRYRTNVWDYAGISSLGANRADTLAMHPTVKPVALVADAIKDCSRRNEIVLDIFGGSGSTLIAAQTCGRRGYLIEYDPLYCDTVIRRWQTFTGKQARLHGGSQTFDDMATERLAEPLVRPTSKRRAAR